MNCRLLKVLATTAAFHVTTLTSFSLSLQIQSRHLSLPPSTPAAIRKKKCPTTCEHSYISTKINADDSFRSINLQMNSNSDDDLEALPVSILGAVGVVVQPVVWTSLYYVVTTGGGLPAGPFGLLGLIEGLSYLVILGLVVASLYQKVTTGSGLRGSNLLGAAEGLSFVTLAVALFALLGLVTDQGCIPNAKPIFDYSAYVKVCDTGQTPGLFGQ